MLRTNFDHQVALRRMREQHEYLANEARALVAMGLSEDEIKRATDPIRSFHLQLVEEVADYERRRNSE